MPKDIKGALGFPVENRRLSHCLSHGAQTARKRLFPVTAWLGPFPASQIHDTT